MNRLITTVILLALLGTASCGGDVVVVSEIDKVSGGPEVPPWAKVAPEQIAEAKKHGVPVAFENDVGMRFVLIPAGAFLMGSPEDEEGRGDDETQHEVTITKPYYMQITEVTVREYYGLRVASGTQPRPPSRPYPPERAHHPVSDFHTDACQHAEHLSKRDTVRSYRLPTEAEWEYACRAGTTTAYSTGEAISVSDANYGSSIVNERGSALYAAVAAYPPNGWGLHDMHGNVREWCQERYAPYSPGAATDPFADASAWCLGLGEERVRRGGCLRDEASELRSARRTHQTGSIFSAGLRFETGFRLVSPLPEPKRSR